MTGIPAAEVSKNTEAALPQNQETLEFDGFSSSVSQHMSLSIFEATPGDS